MSFVRQNLKGICLFALFACAFASLCYYASKSGFSVEQTIRTLWDSYVEDFGYVILFFWSVLEGEWGLVLAGIASHQGYLNVLWCIFIAGLGGFTGDQIYFYIGRLNRRYVQRKFRSQRRKFAFANALMRKYGWPIIFIQRYMYGFRTIIPISIGLTRYSSLKFALINLISAWMWAAITLIPVWYFGDEILEFLQAVSRSARENPLALIVLLGIILCVGATVYLLVRRGRRLNKEGEEENA